MNFFSNLCVLVTLLMIFGSCSGDNLALADKVESIESTSGGQVMNRGGNIFQDEKQMFTINSQVKQKLIGKGKDKISDLLGGILGGTTNDTKTDSTKTDSTKINPNDKIKEGVKDVLGGILGGKKKTKDKKVQDSTKN